MRRSGLPRASVLSEPVPVQRQLPAEALCAVVELLLQLRHAAQVKSDPHAADRAWFAA